MEDKKAIIESIRKEIESHNYSLREFSTMCGVSFSTLSRILRGSKDIAPHTLRRLKSYVLKEPKKKATKRQLIKVGQQEFLITIEAV